MINLGQVAYEAYVRSCEGVSVNGDPLPSWEDQRPEIRQHWERAANAVVDVYHSGAA